MNGEQVLKIVEQVLEISHKEMLERNKTLPNMWKRHIAMYFCHYKGGEAKAAVARLMGRCTGTVFNAIDAFDGKRRCIPEFARMCQKVEDALVLLERHPRAATYIQSSLNGN
jgi:chromosomal replication initiation ATPase DnaA